MEWYWFVAIYIVVMVAGCFICGWRRRFDDVPMMLIWPVGIPVVMAVRAAEWAEELSREFRWWLDDREDRKKASLTHDGG